jgi:hypothetical protein
VKCKDIPDQPIIQFLASLNGRWANWWTDHPASVLNAMPVNTPPKLGLAKMRMLMRRNLVDGCNCGCRGDFELTPRGQSMVTA